MTSIWIDRSSRWQRRSTAVESRGEYQKNRRREASILNLLGTATTGRFVRVVALVVALSSLSPPPSQGRTAAEDLPEEVVVTAQRREEPIAEAPLTVHVTTGSELRDAGIESTQDLAFRTPGLTFSTNTVLGQPYLRGVGSDLITAGAENTVATFQDGVYLARPASAIQDFFDVRRVEVLKGPQGTLFGRNATGGVVHILTHEPERELTAEAEASYGSFDALRLGATLNVPLVPERAYLRVSALRNRRDGFVENRLDDGDLDDEDLFAIRAKLLLEPLESLSILVSGDGSIDHGTRNLVFKLGQPLSGSPAVGAGGVVPRNPRQVLFDHPVGADFRSWGASARVRWQTDRVEVTSVTAVRRTDFEEHFDLDGTDLAFASNAPSEDSTVLTEELQIRSRDDSEIDWIVGVFVLDEDASQTIDVSLPPLGLRDQPSGEVASTALGLFADLTWAPIDRVRLSAGLRYSRDWREIDFLERINGSEAARFKQDLAQDGWTPRFVLEVIPNDEVTVYASAARGYKAGGFNTTAAQEGSFAPEDLWAFELGARGPAYSDRFRAHAAGFVYLYEDIQINVLEPGSLLPFPLIQNAGKATIFGGEVGFDWEVSEGLHVDGAATFLNAAFDRLTAVDPNAPTANPDQSGNRVPNAPAVSLSTSARYTIAIGRLGTLTPRVDYHYQSRVYFEVFEDALSSQRAYGLIDAQLGYEPPDGRVTVRLFGRNLTNELYAHTITRRDGIVGTLTRWGAPRIFGGGAEFRF